MARRGDSEDIILLASGLREVDKKLTVHVAECDILRAFIKDALTDIKQSNKRAQVFMATAVTLMLGTSLMGADKMISAWLKSHGIILP